MRFVGRAADSKSRKQGHFSSRPPSLVHHGGTERHRFRWIRLLGLNGALHPMSQPCVTVSPFATLHVFSLIFFVFPIWGGAWGSLAVFGPLSWLTKRTQTHTPPQSPSSLGRSNRTVTRTLVQPWRHRQGLDFAQSRSSSRPLDRPAGSSKGSPPPKPLSSGSEATFSASSNLVTQATDHHHRHHQNEGAQGRGCAHLPRPGQV